MAYLEEKGSRDSIETINCHYHGTNFCLSLAFQTNGLIGEVTAHSFKPINDLQFLARDVCTLISALLQRFVSPSKLAELVKPDEDSRAASLVGLIINQISQIN